MKAEGTFSVLSAGDEETSSLLSTVLSFSNIVVVAVDTVAEALKIAKGGGFDGYILGMRFPDGDGFELCQALKSQAPYVPIAFYTGDVAAADRTMGLFCGADAYLEKPYQGDLGSFVLELIRGGRQRKIAYVYARSHRRRGMRLSAGII